MHARQKAVLHVILGATLMIGGCKSDSQAPVQTAATPAPQPIIPQPAQASGPSALKPWGMVTPQEAMLEFARGGVKTVWMKVNIDQPVWRPDFEEKKIIVPPWIDSFIPQAQPKDPKPHQISLVRMSVDQLGFHKGATLQQIDQSARFLRLELCPPEVALQLRIQYLSQPFGEVLRVAMDPVFDANGKPNIYGVANDRDGLKLVSYSADPATVWGSDSFFLFVYTN
jgi:hypothetical protein